MVSPSDEPRRDAGARPGADVIRARPPIAISVVMPVRDEAGSLGAVIDELVAVLAARAFQIIVVDDGSRDQSWALIRSRAEEDPRIVGVRLGRRRGKSIALCAGAKAAEGAIVVTIDGDGQDVPAEIPKLLEALGTGAARGCVGGAPLDLVGGRRVARKDSLGKRACSAAFNVAVAIVTGVHLRDHNTGLKAGRREVFDATPLSGGLHRYLFVLARQRGFRVGEVDVAHRPRLAGRSKYGPLRAIGAFADLVAVCLRQAITERATHWSALVSVRDRPPAPAIERAGSPP